MKTNINFQNAHPGPTLFACKLNWEYQIWFQILSSHMWQVANGLENSGLDCSLIKEFNYYGDKPIKIGDVLIVWVWLFFKSNLLMFKLFGCFHFFVKLKSLGTKNAI